ncbi:mechanosensitive ion channel family protein [Cerasicoccus fimbriatus]|uniref:mechanosensitive ion channel family protein n=1 Tax=Cerasicoccus fimbriatus TaxID=3014554 RepID=UPI0022B3706D|nr:mechanosensitive ion channel domain-containing protein [Cerasicoccus sp. TK19100]
MNALQWLCPTVEAAKPENWWQVIVVGVVWLAIFSVFRGKTGDPNERYNPKIWFKENAELPILALVMAVLAAAMAMAEIATPVFRVAATLFVMWTVIGVVTSFIRDRFWAQSTAGILFLMSAAMVLTVDDAVVDFLETITLPIPAGGESLSLWKLFTVAASLAVALWIGIGFSQFVERRVDTIDRINASTRALIGKIIRIFFIIIAMVVGLTSVGVNLSALTVFGGALGLGLGFGLQKIVSNLISGFILLSDRSIKPGDVIELDDTYGWINSLRARYVSVITRDGTEHLIPNEDLITQRVVNWSFTHDRVRIKIDVGISYKEDPHQAIEICKAAAAKQSRVIKEPAPICLLKGFGDSSVDLQLRFWIRDPHEGVANIQSAVLLEIWDRFKEEGIEIPFPQRDLHIKSSVPLVMQSQAEKATDRDKDSEDEGKN